MAKYGAVRDVSPVSLQAGCLSIGICGASGHILRSGMSTGVLLVRTHTEIFQSHQISAAKAKEGADFYILPDQHNLPPIIHDFEHPTTEIPSRLLEGC